MIERPVRGIGANAQDEDTIKNVIVHYLGPPGTYSHQVALGIRDRLLNGSSYVEGSSRGAGFKVLLQPCATINDTAVKAEKVAEGSLGLALLPYENNTNGPVIDSFDLIHDATHHGVQLIADDHLSVNHSLLVTKETAKVLQGDKESVTHSDLQKLDSISSHVQALGQCSEFLDRHTRGDAARIETTSTGEGAKSLFDGRPGLHAAIASRVCVQDDVYGLREVFGNIQNSNGNTTRFLLCQVDRVLSNSDKVRMAALQLAPTIRQNDKSVKAVVLVQSLNKHDDRLTSCLQVFAEARIAAAESGVTLINTKIDRKARRAPEGVKHGQPIDGVWSSTYVVEVEAHAANAQDCMKSIDFLRPLLEQRCSDAVIWLGSWYA